jgi:catechol 2,3-dioxygenase-like lactoylglutathione lyase family enzyme
MSITMGNTASAAHAHVSRLRRLHHAAWVTRDQEATRHFYEDIIGLPLAATQPGLSGGRLDVNTVTPFLPWATVARWRFSSTLTRTNNPWS